MGETARPEALVGTCLQEVVLDDVTNDAVLIKVAAAALRAKVLAEDHLHAWPPIIEALASGHVLPQALPFLHATFYTQQPHWRASASLWPQASTDLRC